MSTKEIEETTSVHNVHSILKRNGINQKIMNGIENNADEKIIYDRSRSSSDPIENLDHSIQRKTKVANIRKDSLQVNNLSFTKNDSKNRPRFGEIIEISSEIDDDDSLEAVSRKTSDFITTEEHLKIVEPVKDVIPEKKEMTLLEVSRRPNSNVSVAQNCAKRRVLSTSMKSSILFGYAATRQSVSII